MSFSVFLLLIYFFYLFTFNLEQHGSATENPHITSQLALHICDSATTDLTNLRSCRTVVHSTYLLKKI